MLDLVEHHVFQLGVKFVERLQYPVKVPCAGPGQPLVIEVYDAAGPALGKLVGEDGLAGASYPGDHEDVGMEYHRRGAGGRIPGNQAFPFLPFFKVLLLASYYALEIHDTILTWIYKMLCNMNK